MIYAVKFKEKGNKEQVISVLFEAQSEKEFSGKLKRFFEDEAYDVDKRTISWSGNSVPLSRNNALVIYADLDELT